MVDIFGNVVNSDTRLSLKMGKLKIQSLKWNLNVFGLDNFDSVDP